MPSPIDQHIRTAAEEVIDASPPEGPHRVAVDQARLGQRLLRHRAVSMQRPPRRPLSHLSSWRHGLESTRAPLLSWAVEPSNSTVRDGQETHLKRSFGKPRANDLLTNCLHLAGTSRHERTLSKSERAGQRVRAGTRRHRPTPPGRLLKSAGPQGPCGFEPHRPHDV